MKRGFLPGKKGSWEDKLLLWGFEALLASMVILLLINWTHGAIEDTTFYKLYFTRDISMFTNAVHAAPNPLSGLYPKDVTGYRIEFTEDVIYVDEAKQVDAKKLTRIRYPFQSDSTIEMNHPTFEYIPMPCVNPPKRSFLEKKWDDFAGKECFQEPSLMRFTNYGKKIVIDESASPELSLHTMRCPEVDSSKVQKSVTIDVTIEEPLISEDGTRNELTLVKEVASDMSSNKPGKINLNGDGIKLILGMHDDSSNKLKLKIRDDISGDDLKKVQKLSCLIINNLAKVGFDGAAVIKTNKELTGADVVVRIELGSIEEKYNNLVNSKETGGAIWKGVEEFYEEQESVSNT